MRASKLIQTFLDECRNLSALRFGGTTEGKKKKKKNGQRSFRQWKSSWVNGSQLSKQKGMPSSGRRKESPSSPQQPIKIKRSLDGEDPGHSGGEFPLSAAPSWSITWTQHKQQAST